MGTDSAANASRRPTLTTITRKEINRAKDLNYYRIIDWGRNYMSWSRQRAQQVLLRLLKGSTITIAEVGAYESAPEGPTFPNWNHNPEHNRMARHFWRWFYWRHPRGYLYLADQPDFGGHWGREEGPHFYGDFNSVSVQAFLMTLAGMTAEDLWISVVQGGAKQVIIEPCYDVGLHLTRAIAVRL